MVVYKLHYQLKQLEQILHTLKKILIDVEFLLHLTYYLVQMLLHLRYH